MATKKRHSVRGRRIEDLVNEVIDRRLKYYRGHVGKVEKIEDDEKGIILFSCLPLGAIDTDPDSWLPAQPISKKEAEKKPEKGKDVLLTFPYADWNSNQVRYVLIEDTDENETKAGGSTTKQTNDSWEFLVNENLGIRFKNGAFEVNLGSGWVPPLFPS